MEPLYTCCENGMLSQVQPTDLSGLCPDCKRNQHSTTPPAAQPATEKSSETQTASAYVKTYHGGKPWPLQPAPEKGQP